MTKPQDAPPPYVPVEARFKRGMPGWAIVLIIAAALAAAVGLGGWVINQAQDETPSRYNDGA